MTNTDLLNVVRSGSGEPLVILHGLFGSSKNWQSLARHFAKHFEVFSIDLRNHGQSFHHEDMNYEIMADDVSRLLVRLGVSSCGIIGHSMGGKTSILLALLKPQQISRMIIADIAPVPYGHAYDHLIDPILALSIGQSASRTSIDKALELDIPDPLLRGFLLQNLDRVNGQWRWRINWRSIKDNLDRLTGFPELADDWFIDLPTLFIRGDNSEYITSREEQVIATHFGQAAITTIPDAGHWLHAEQPDRFASQVLAFLRPENS